MNQTSVACPCCKKKMILFGSQIRQRHGCIRCLGCGARIPYDLDHPQEAGAGFWPRRVIPFRFKRK
ncbi:MAG TPA: hypothetical protein DCS74_03395 [Veillonellaceae bacterium]|nr:hypothetical protein [Veillonellaceae bacterium]